MNNFRISDEVPPPVDAGREATLRWREERRNVPTWPPVCPGNRVSIKQADRLVCENNQRSLRNYDLRGRFLLSLRSFPGEPTLFGAPAAFGCRGRTAAGVGIALQSGIGTPDVSVGTREGEATVPHSSADFRGSSVASMPRPVPARALEAGPANGCRLPVPAKRLHQPDRVSRPRAVLRLRRANPRDWRRHDVPSRTQGNNPRSPPHEADMRLRNRVPQIAMCAPRGNSRRQSYASS